MGYSYFDTPDGEDCNKKLFYMVKKAGLAGFFTSGAYVTLVETPTNYYQFFGRFARITTPIVAAAAAGTISICLLVNQRKKDDRLNYYLGGWTAGIAGGIAKGHLGQGAAAGFALGFVCFLIKEAQIHNVPIVTDYKMNIHDFWTKDNDYSVMRKVPKDWIEK